ncbi:MAG: dipeptidase PepV [Tepidanaerobacteraceae bacterium]|jgi:succinyl-diaminopimelate desuccinylase|nr:dipeptidase PepV [Tepidanaerobacteraceae bacterium]
MADMDSLIDQWKDEIVEETRNLIKIRSVEEPAKNDRPFGDGPYEALRYSLELSEKLGFSTRNHENFAGHAEWGQGRDIVGILVHLDVVPEGSGWSYPPYEGRVVDGKIYGRGASDDKGPAVAALYALRAVKEAGIPLKKRVRIIFGTNEESGWGCMKHYFEEKKEEIPAMGFSPDAGFPIINREKGILIFNIDKNFERLPEKIRINSIKGGQRPNMVPDYCEADIRVKDDLREDIMRKFDSFKKGKDASLEMEESSDGFIVKSYGVSAHGSTPENGKNAIVPLAEFLAELFGCINDENNDVAEFIKFIAKYIGCEIHGESLNIHFKDEPSGDLVLNLGMVEMDENKGRLVINIRYPVTFKGEEVIKGLESSLAGIDKSLKLSDISDNPPLYVPADSPLVIKLQKVYKEVTGEEPELIAIGGGTYARAIPNAVAFGAQFPGKPEVAHERDEYIEIDDLIRCTKIFAHAIAALAGE